jgi:hypothetical protein
MKPRCSNSARAIRPALATLEARTGKTIEYESEDARKNIGR